MSSPLSPAALNFYGTTPVAVASIRKLDPIQQTQHTLAEVVPVLQEMGLALRATPINRFGPIESLEGLYRQEAVLEVTAQRYLDERR
jgi:hypothetical protein